MREKYTEVLSEKAVVLQLQAIARLGISCQTEQAPTENRPNHCLLYGSVEDFDAADFGSDGEVTAIEFAEVTLKKHTGEGGTMETADGDKNGDRKITKDKDEWLESCKKKAMEAKALGKELERPISDL